MIYLILSGRIGNQLFMYAAARTVQMMTGDTQKIVIEDMECIQSGYENCLPYYDFPNVEYVHDRNILYDKRMWRQRICLDICGILTGRKTKRKRFEFEKKYQKIINSFGVFLCEDGFLHYPGVFGKNTVMRGYFQSEKYFEGYADIIRREFAPEHIIDAIPYPNLQRIRDRNSVCISIKVQHNVGSEMYDVCTKEYWERAIEYITAHVDAPLFFVCSDDVQYVREHLIDCDRYDVVEQDNSFPVHVSLAVMAKCKHFIIGNTSFGWWAQYLSDNKDKIVVAPSKWYKMDVPCDIYQENWVKIPV